MSSLRSSGRVLQWIRSHFHFPAIPKILNLCLQRKNLMFFQNIISETMLQSSFLAWNPSHSRCTLSHPWNRQSSMPFSQKISKLVVSVTSSYLWQHLSFISRRRIACSLQLVQDYHALNSMTIKNQYSLLLISEIVSQLWEAKYFTKLNICWGFNNVQIKPGDE